MFERFNGNVVPFADESTSTNRTVFGSETQSDDIDDNLNADFKKGWEIVGLNDNPTREDFNAMGYTLGYLTSYLYQNGVAEYNLLQEYKTNSIAIGTDGNIYQSLVDNNLGNALTDATKWVCIASKNSIVNSIAELKTISNIESINVLGYYEKGDGGGGTFYWDATSIEADNGGTIIQATGVTTGRWKRVFSGAVNVKWFKLNTDVDDTDSIQRAINSMTIPKIILDGDIIISSTITLTVYGATIDLTNANVSITGGTGFTLNLPQVLNATYFASNDPLDSNGSYFYPIKLIGGRVTVLNGASLAYVRRPFLYSDGFDYKALYVLGTDIFHKDDSKIFQLHGGWGFVFDGISVNGEHYATGWQGSVFQIIPDGTYFKSSHPQNIKIVNSKFEGVRVFYTDNGLCTNSLEDLELSNVTCAFSDFGIINLGNYINIKSGMYVIYGDMIFESCSQVNIVGTYLQREQGNTSPTSLLYGACTFRGGSSSIIIDDIIGVMPISGDGISHPSGGHLFSFFCRAEEQYFSINISNVFVTRIGIDNISEVSSGTSSVIRFHKENTGIYHNVNLKNIGCRSTHSVIDMNDIATPANFKQVTMDNIYATGLDTARRVRNITNANAIYAPQMYKKMTLSIYGQSEANSTAGRPVASQTVDVTGFKGTITSSITGFTSISNAQNILDYGGSNNARTFVITQIGGLPVGTSVNGYATIELNCSNSI